MGIYKIIFLLLIGFGYSENVQWKDIRHIVIKECMFYPGININPYLIRGIMYQESRIVKNNIETFKTTARSWKNARGLMQITPIGLRKHNRLVHIDNKIIEEINKTNDIKIPLKLIIKWKDICISETNIHVGVGLFARAMARYNRDYSRALMYYSCNAKRYDIRVLQRMTYYFSRKYSKKKGYSTYFRYFKK